MKKVLIFVVTLFAVSSVFASEGEGNAAGEGREGKRHEMQLDLTDAQKTQMKALREKHRAERQAMQERHKADIKAILTAEQLAKFEQSRGKRHDMKGGEEGERMRGKGMKGDRNMEHKKPEKDEQE